MAWHLVILGTLLNSVNRFPLYEVTIYVHIVLIGRRNIYRVTMVVAHLGWIDSDLGSSPRPVGCYCSYLLPKRRVEHPKSKSTQPRCATTMVTL